MVTGWHTDDSSSSRRRKENNKRKFLELYDDSWNNNAADKNDDNVGFPKPQSETEPWTLTTMLILIILYRQLIYDCCI
jgi:hypothetical protein